MASRWTKRRRINAEVHQLMKNIETSCNNLHNIDVSASDTDSIDPEVENLPSGSSVSCEHNYEVAEINRTGDLLKCKLIEEEPVQISGSNAFQSPSDRSDDRSNDCKFNESDTDSEDLNLDLDINTSLQMWAIEHNITHSALKALLKILSPHHPLLPKDPRTLLGIKKIDQCDLKVIEGGQYYHFGIEKGIISSLNAYHDSCCNQLQLQINIDGLPLFKSTNSQFWPILGLIQNNDMPITSPFIIGLFCGQSKPGNLYSYLEDFIQEYTHLQSCGFFFNNLKYSICITCFICDAPARAYVKAVKSHSGYFGCDKCTQEGVYVENRMTFPETEASLRTDISFDEMLDDNHHKGVSPLTSLKLGMVSKFPLDYMHLVCLGVVKKLLLLWLKGPLCCRIGGRVKQQLSNSLLSFCCSIPCEFARKPRSLDEIDRWKATEFRLFLLYTGPIALVGKVSDAVYKNFMLLFVAIHILVSPSMSSCVELVNYAQKLLVTFVKHTANLYGPQSIVYNVHGLIHLPADVKEHGCLDSFSSFPFENFLGKLKRMLRKPGFPLSQIILRIREHDLVPKHSASNASKCILLKEHVKGPVPPNRAYSSCRQFEKAKLPRFQLSILPPDCYVKIGPEIGMVKNILMGDSSNWIVYMVFLNKLDLFKYPVNSTKIGIFKVSVLSTELRVCPIDLVEQKVVLMPMENDYYAAVPLTHTC